jgi:hypothetical protein
MKVGTVYISWATISFAKKDPTSWRQTTPFDHRSSSSFCHSLWKHSTSTYHLKDLEQRAFWLLQLSNTPYTAFFLRHMQAHLDSDSDKCRDLASCRDQGCPRVKVPRHNSVISMQKLWDVSQWTPAKIRLDYTHRTHAGEVAEHERGKTR